MPSLLELQEGFAAALEDAGRAAATALFRGAGGGSTSRIAVYRGNVHANRTKALASAYPVVRKIVGDEFFDATAREFSRAFASTSGDLNRYGERFAEFLERFPHVADLPYLPDVARLEWFVHRAHFAADPAPFDPSPLARLAPEDLSALRVKLAPACALLESAWPLARIWEIHQDDYHGAFAVDMHESARVLVHRPRWRALVQSLEPGDFAFLSSVLQGGTLGDALAAGDRHADFHPSTVLARWIEARVIAGVA